MAAAMETTSRATVEIIEVLELEPNGHYCLPYGMCSLRVLSGVAWVTAQAEDHILKCGDDLTIPRQPHAVIVSAAHQQRLRFEVYRR